MAKETGTKRNKKGSKRETKDLLEMQIKEKNLCQEDK